MMSEDDTFRILKRIPFKEMSKQYMEYWDSLKMNARSPTGDDFHEELGLFARNGWTVQEFMSHSHRKE